MIPMQQQGFPMVPVMQSNMPGMMGMNYGSQMPPGPMTMQVRGGKMWAETRSLGARLKGARDSVVLSQLQWGERVEPG